MDDRTITKEGIISYLYSGNPSHRIKRGKPAQLKNLNSQYCPKRFGQK